MEAFGYISEIGSQVTSWNTGDQVIIGVQSGCYATEINVKPHNIFPAFPHLTSQENAAFLVNWATAYLALNLYGTVNKNQIKVLINSAAGGVGSAAVLMAKAMGAYVIGAVSRDDKFDFVESIGADQVINYRTHNYELFNHSIDLCLESVGGTLFYNSLNSLKPLGKIISIGMSNIQFSWRNPFTWLRAYRTIPRISALKLIGVNAAVIGLHLGKLLDSGLLRQFQSKLIQFVKVNNLKPVVNKIFPLNEAAKAHELLESRKTTGKLLLNCKIE